jgi:hypothetical protein
MHAHTNPKTRWIAHTLAGLGMAGMAQATLLLYEGFGYTSGTPAGPSANGFALNGQSGGTGMTGTWSTFTASSSPITVYSQGSQSGVNLNNTGPVALDYDGTVANLPTSGGYFGMGGSNTTDHMLVWRTLDPSVTATFVEGATTWFSFVSVRGYVANPGGMKLALGKGPLLEDRGQLSTGEAIGGGGGLGSSVRNANKVYPQFWDNATGSPGETTGTFTNYDVMGIEVNSGALASYLSAPWAAAGIGPTAPQVEGLDTMLLHHVSGAQPNGARNIIIGKIEWHDGSPDVISVVRFLATDTLSEAAFNTAIAAQPNLSSANWSGTKPDLDQSKFDTISLAGGKWFADEIRVSTTFGEVIGVSPPADPYAAWAVAKGLDGTAGKEAGAGDDPDKDGRTNLDEFAFDGNPLSGANDGKVVGRTATLIDTSKVLILTLPVRAGAVFNGPGDLVSDPVDGIVYQIQGSDDLVDFTTMGVTEITGADATAIQTGLPSLTGWVYRTFRSPGIVTDGDSRDFLRAGVSQP